MFKLIGIRKIDFIDSQSGNHIVGNTIYVTCHEDGVVGVSGKKYFVSTKIDLSSFKIGDNIEIYFNDKGKVQSIIISK